MPKKFDHILRIAILITRPDGLMNWMQFLANSRNFLIVLRLPQSQLIPLFLFGMYSQDNTDCFMPCMEVPFAFFAFGTRRTDR